MKSIRVPFLAAVLCAACHAGSGPQTPSSPMVGNDDGALGASPKVNFAIAQEAPLGLTASDGTGLRLAKLEAEAVVDGPLAFTELKMAFENTQDRVLEGTFRIALPQGASIGRFAMKINGEWQEGEVVELAAARRAYEDFLHRKQDPALMEKSAGNEFSARVFPIPARGVKEIVVAYAHEVHEGKYTLPLKGLPELGSLDVKAHVVGAKSQPRPLASRGVAPAFDFVADVRADVGDPKAKVSGIRQGDLAILRVKPTTETHPDPLASVLVLVDTSASRVLGYEEELRVVDRLVKQVAAGNGSVVVAAFDQNVAPIFDGRATQFTDRDLTRLRDRGALGASDLERALTWAKETARAKGMKRVVVVGDGVATAGATDTKKLSEKVSALKEAGVERIDAVAVGGIRDDVGLTKLVRGNLARDGVVAAIEGTDGSQASERAIKRLGEATRSNVPVKIEGATWAWPTKLDGVQAGDAYTVYAEIPAQAPVKVSLDGAAAQVVDLRKSERPLLERSVAQAKVSSLLEREATTKDAADLKKSIIEIAVKNRIVTPYTAMLVLETEADYARFKIDRKSLTDVLAIEGGNVKRLHRTFRAFGGPVVEDKKMVMDLAATEEPRERDGKDKDRESSRPQHKPPPRPADNKPTTSATRGAEGGGGAPTAPGATASARPAIGGKRPASDPSSTADAEPMMKRSVDAAKPAKEAEKAEAPRAAMAPPKLEAKTDSGPRTAPRPAPTSAPPAEPMAAAPPPPPPPPSQQPRGGASEEARVRPGPVRTRPQRDFDSDEPSPIATDDGDGKVLPYEGKFATVMAALKRNHADEALSTARDWRAEEPANVLALVAIGEAAEAKNLTELASRAYGSVIDLFPNRADLRRFAGERLDRLAMKDANALDLAVDTYTKAVADRPDHPASHRLLAYALLKKKQYAKAFEAIVAGKKQQYPSGRFAGVDHILAEDVGLIGAAWAKNEPGRADEIRIKIREVGGVAEDGPSLRFVLVWETDANDVDFHIHDSRGGHAYYGQRNLQSGGNLYADVTTGYGPECFTIRDPRSLDRGKAAPYKLEAHYYSRGPMGYGMGKLQIVEHDGKGGLSFEERPFVVMVDHAFVDLGLVK